MSILPNISNLVHDLDQQARSNSSNQLVSSAPTEAAVHMSAQDSSESPPEAQDHDKDQDHDLEDGTDPPAKRQKRSRACQACRSMKIRCLPVEGQEACKACSKVNRACIMPGPARKRQKTVHKVAELEKKINALTASLASKQGTNAMAVLTAPTPPTEPSPATTSTPRSTGKNHPSLPKAEKEYAWDSIIEHHYPTMEGPQPRQRGMQYEQVEDPDGDDYEDVVARGVIGEVTAARIYEHFRENMLPYCPIIAFPENTTVEWLRQKKPMTLLSIFVAAAGVIVPDLQPDIAVEMARQMADRVMFYNEKSLDLVQAMLIYSTWYGKHKFAKDLGFNHYIHAAVAMSLDLGLGKRSRQQTYSDADDAEARRTWMGCYYMAGSVATVLRLPPLITYSPYMEECLKSFADHPGATPGDGFLCCLVRLTHLLQDVALLFHMDDPGSNIPLNDSRTQYHLKMFERQLDDWLISTKSYLPEPMMSQYAAVASLYIHEIALHNEHNVDDFRPMYRSTGRETSNTPKDFLTNAHFESLTVCVDSMQRAMHAFLDMDKDMVRGAPALHIVWTAYVAVAMIRLHGVLAVPDSKYGSIFLPKLNVISFLDGCVHKLNLVVANAVHVPSEPFIVAFKKLKAWHIHRTMQQQGIVNSSGQVIGADPERAGEAYIRAYNASAVDMMPTCSGDAASTAGSSRRASSNNAANINQQDSPHDHQRQRQRQQQIPQYQPQQQQQQYPVLDQPYQSQQQQQQQQQPALGASSTLLDSNTAIDASTFDIQNWDFSVGELNSFDNYLNDAGWMAYLM